jgi:hypothetical protein
LPLTAEKRLWRRRLRLRLRLRGTSLIQTKELLLNLEGDSIQPSLGSVRPFLMMPEVGFQLSYSIFSGSQLSRQLMSHSESLLILRLSIRGCAMKQPQNGLGRPVNRIASFRFGV